MRAAIAPARSAGRPGPEGRAAPRCNRTRPRPPRRIARVPRRVRSRPWESRTNPLTWRTKMSENEFQVIPLRAFKDNYVWTLRNARSAAVVDPGEAQPVLNYLAAEKLQLVAIL